MPADKPAADAAKPLFGQFLAVGRMGLRMTSADGNAWSKPQFHKDPHTLASIAVGNGCVVAAGMNGTGSNAFHRSTDLQTWEVQTMKSDYIYMVRSVGFGDGRFMAMLAGGTNRDDGGVEHLSSDGKDWGERIKRDKGSLNRAVFGNGTWTGIGFYGCKAVSTDGRAWQTAPDQIPADTLITIAYGKGVFVGGGLNGLRMASPDGLKWGAKQLGDEGEHIHSMLYTGKEFVGVGLGATFFSPDGQTWTRKPNSDPPVSCAYGKGVFVGSAYKGRIMVSKDAVTWKQALKCEEHILAVAFV